MWVLFFMHIPFVVIHTFNATPAEERLQQVEDNMPSANITRWFTTIFRTVSGSHPGWSPFHLHGLFPVPTQQQSYYHYAHTHRSIALN